MDRETQSVMVCDCQAGLICISGLCQLIFWKSNIMASAGLANEATILMCPTRATAMDEVANVSSIVVQHKAFVAGFA